MRGRGARGLLLAAFVALGIGVLSSAPASGSTPTATGSVLVSRVGSDGDADLFLRELGTGDERELLAEGGHDHSAVWSPDGTKIAFVRQATPAAQAEIYVVDAKGANAPVRITNHAKDDRNPAWTPDGLSIVFDSDRSSSGARHLYRADVANPTPQQLTSNAVDGTQWENYEPTVSPDGWVAYARSEVGVPYVNIYKTHLTTGSTTALTEFVPAPHANRNPEFSPDGTQIAFSTNRTSGNDFDVYVMNADGSSETSLVATTATEDLPRWVRSDGYAGGARLLYTAGSGDRDIRMIDADGTDDTELLGASTGATTNDVFGDMQPLPDCTIAWDGSGAADGWADAANWDLNRVPGAGDKVCIPDMQTPVTITYSSGIRSVESITTYEDLTVNGGTLSTTTLTATSGADVNLSAGTFNGANVNVSGGSFTVSVIGIANVTNLAATADGVLTLTSGTLNATTVAADPDVPMALDGGTLGGDVTLTSGTFNWPADGAAPGAYPWTIGADATLALTTADGAYVLPGTASLVNDGEIHLGTAALIDGPGTVVNRSGATITKSAADATHVTQLNAALDNDAVLSVPSGVVELHGNDGNDPAASSDAGTFDTGDGGEVHFAGGRTNLGRAEALTGSGGFAITNAEVNVGTSGLALPAGVTLKLNSGTLSGRGLLAGGRFVWHDVAAISTPGAFTVADDAVLDLATDGGTYTLPGAGGVTNYGELNLNSAALVQGAGTLRNAASGTVNKTGSSSTDIDTAFDNQGAMDVEAGTLQLRSSMTTNDAPALDAGVFRGGTYRVGDSGALTFDGLFSITDNRASFDLSGTAVVNDTTGESVFRNLAVNDGSLTLHDGAVAATNAALSNTGDVILGSGSTLSAPSYNQTTAGSLTRLTGAPAATLDTDAVFNGGRLEGQGILAGDLVNDGAVIAPGSPTGTLAVSGDFTQNAGTLDIDIRGRDADTFDALAVTGAATLNGALDVTTQDFAPAWDDEFPLITAAGTPTGSFAALSGLSLPSGMTYEPRRVAGGLRLLVNDTVDPTNATPTSPSHTLSSWSADRTVEIDLAGASDVHSGVDGYAIVWDTSPDTEPAKTKTLEQTAATAISPRLANGAGHYVHVRTKDNDGNWSGTTSLGPFWIDGAAPRGGRITAPAAMSTSLLWSNGKPRVRVSWTKTSDAHSGLARTRVIHRSSSNGTSWASAKKTMALRATSYSRAAKPGSTHCFKVRRTDTVGNTATTGARCTTVPHDNISLAKTKAWTTPKARGYYAGSSARSTVNGATLAKRVTAKRITLVATKCRGCGSVKLFFKGRAIGKTISLNRSGAAPAHKQVIPIGRLRRVSTGTLVVKVVSAGKPVFIDAVGTSLR